MSAALDEPSIPQRAQRPLGALWISVGLHAALIALVQVAPPPGAGVGARIIEARLVNVQAVSPDRDADTPTPRTPRLEPVEASRPEDVATVEPVERLPDALTPDRPEPADATPEPTEPIAAPAPEVPDAPVTVSAGVDLTFYSARDLDVQPRALTDIVPTYPEEADRQRLSGTVVLELRLEADGRVLDASVVRATPPDVFDATTVAAFEQARFAPAIRNGQPVRAQMLIEVTYNWAGRPLPPHR